MIMSVKAGQTYDNHCFCCLEYKDNAVQLMLRRVDGVSIIGFTCCLDCIAKMGTEIVTILKETEEKIIKCDILACSHNKDKRCSFLITNQPGGMYVEEYDECIGFIDKEED